MVKFKQGLDLDNICGDWAYRGLWESSSRVWISAKRLQVGSNVELRWRLLKYVSSLSQMWDSKYSELDILRTFQIQQRRSEDQFPKFEYELESLAAEIEKSNFHLDLDFV